MGKGIVITVALLICVPLILVSLVVRVYIDEYKIEHRSLFGVRKSMAWADIRCVYETYASRDDGYLIIHSDRDKMTIGFYMVGFDSLERQIEKYYPDAFNARQVIQSDVKTKYFSTRGKITRFDANRVYFAIGVITILVVGAVMLMPENPPSNVAVKIILLGMLSFCAFILIAVSLKKLYVSSDSILLNTYGKRLEMRWQDINCVRTDMPGRIDLYSGKTRIRIYADFPAYPVIEDLVQQFAPKAARFAQTDKQHGRIR